LRSGSGGRRVVVGILVGVLWLGFCVWLFAFSYSNSYFKYADCARIAVFAAAMLGAAVIPAGAFLVLRRLEGALAVILWQAGVSLLGLLPLAVTNFLLSRIRGACRLSGDDSMGAGIDFLLLAAIAALSVAAAGLVAAMRAARRRRGVPRAGGRIGASRSSP